MSSDFKCLCRAVLDRIDDLCRFLEIALRGARITAADAVQITSSADKAATALREAVQKLSVEHHEGMAEADHRSIHALLDELSILGIGKGALSIKLTLQSCLSLIPREIPVKLKQVAERLRDWDKVDRAIASGVFLEWVRHNPGKGYWKKFSPFKENVQYDHDGYEQSWVECEIFVYRPDRWVNGTTFHHNEAPCAGETVYSEIDPALAAAKLVAAFPIGLDLEQIIWLTEVAGTQTEVKPKIVWDRELYKLYVDGQLARRIKQPNRAKNIIKILNAFQKKGWPERIKSPFARDEDGRTKCRETIRQLKKWRIGIQFEADGTGEGVRWRLNPGSVSTSDQPAKGDLPF